MGRMVIVLLVVLAVLVVVAVVVRNRGDEGDEGKIVIEYWDRNPGENRTPYTAEVIRRFEEKYPEYKVKHVTPPYAQSLQKIIIAAQAGDPPDCSEIFSGDVVQLAAMGALENLEPYIAEWEGRDEIDEAAWEVARAYGSPAYFVPTRIGTDILYYRKDWFKEAGVDPPSNWGELLEAAKRFTDPAKVPPRYGFGMRGGTGGGGYTLHFMTAATGGQIFDEEGNCLLNGPGPVEGLQFYADLFLKHKVTPPTALTDGYREMISSFYSGVTAMYIHNNGSIGDQMLHLEEGQFGTRRLPDSPWGPMTPAVGSNGYAIYNGSKVKDAAWKLVSFFASQEQSSYWSSETGIMPANKLSQQESWFQDNVYNQAVFDTLGDKEHLAQTLLHLPESATMDDELLRPELQLLLLGKQTAQETADNIAAELSKYQKEWLAERKEFQERESE